MGKFAIKTVKTGNGEVIATSEIYTSRSACLNGIERVRKNVPEDKVVDVEN